MNRIQKRFEHLTETANKIADASSVETKHIPERLGYIRGSVVPARQSHTYKIDWQAVIQWSTSARLLLANVFSRESTTFEAFESAYSAQGLNSIAKLKNMQAVFAAAKEDFEGGYILEIRNLANAVVFKDELEQAQYFLEEQHRIPAAVIAGTVLESTIRNLCEQTSAITLPDKPSAAWMNDQLKNENVYDKTEQAQNLSWLHIRNHAAHGKPEFASVTDDEIKRMIEGIRGFVAKHMS